MYDYIIAGTGAAGLSLAYHLQQSSALRQKKLLLIDKAPKQGNDRTWCFWAQPEFPFAEILAKQWRYLDFHGVGFAQKFDIDPYRYCLLRSADFYQYIQEALLKNPSVEFVYGEIEDLQSHADKASVRVNEQSYEAAWAFSSLPAPRTPKDGHFYLKQHFKGYWLEVPQDTFEMDSAGFMDFRIPQVAHEARFMYVLPLSARKALVEFTIFSEQLLPQAEQYDAQLQAYIKDFLKIKDYHIGEEEFGIIPMDSEPYPAQIGSRILNIGIAGGAAKPSSGYAFLRMQKQAKALVAQLEKRGRPTPYKPLAQYQLYDNTLLNVMATEKYPASKAFTRLFERHPIHRIFRFLDEESSFWKDDLKIMWEMPHLPFLKAVWENRRLL